MGARVSIQFVKGEDTSPALFSHWGGMEFVKEAKRYAKRFRKGAEASYPLQRGEPQTVLVDFIRHVTKDLKKVEHNLYLGVDEKDGDNSDYGHHLIDCSKK